MIGIEKRKYHHGIMNTTKEIKRIYELQSDPKNVLSLRNSSHQDRIAKIKSITIIFYMKVITKVLQKLYIRTLENLMKRSLQLK